MLTTGLVSITFRKLTSPEIIHLVRKSGLKSIEWGGDVHVPHGNLSAAREVRKRTDDAGLSVAAYGSYYRVGKSEKDQAPFEDVLMTASELKAPTIRVWAGTAGSAETDAATRTRIVRETRRIADLAAEAGITISFEFHANTLTDTHPSAVALLEEADHPNVFSLWQPRSDGNVDDSLAGLQAILPRLTNVHAFYWTMKEGQRQRRLLADGEAPWLRYLQTVRSSGRDHKVLIEFVRDDDPEAFLADAKTLTEWIQETNK
jgi:3-dehydroshikimate dehydratase